MATNPINLCNASEPELKSLDGIGQAKVNKHPLEKEKRILIMMIWPTSPRLSRVLCV